MTRRDLLRLLVSLSAWIPAPLLLAALSDADKPGVLPALGPFLDTLLPQDDSPSATQLGVDQTILESANQVQNLPRIIELGCAWLDKQASGLGIDGFEALDEAQQVAIVAAAEHSEDRSLPKVFFMNMQRLAFEHYYSNPGSWPGLGYPGPPQPLGFAHHDRAPGSTTL